MQDETKAPETSACIADTKAKAENSDEERLYRTIWTALGRQEVVFDVAPRPPLVASLSEGQALFTNSFFSIRPSELGGWGAFATRDLHKGDHILIERALFHASGQGILDAFDALDEAQQALVLDMHAYNPRGDAMAGKVLAVWDANCFLCEDDIQGPGLFPLAGRFNHACAPRSKVAYAFDAATRVMTFTVVAEMVPKGEELTISYGKEPIALRWQYGFNCCCGACDGVPDGYTPNYDEIW